MMVMKERGETRQELEMDANFMAPFGLISKLTTVLQHLNPTANAAEFF